MAEKDSKTQLAELMYQDEEMRPLMDKWAEEKFPGTAARIATARSAETAKAEIAKEREAWRVEIEQEKAARSRERYIDQIKRDPNLRIRDDEVPEIEKLMRERGIGTYEDAAYRFRQINYTAPPAPSGPSRTIEIPGQAEDNDGSWLKSAFTARGVNLGLVDKLTKQRTQTILDDFRKDPTGAATRWA